MIDPSIKQVLSLPFPTHAEISKDGSKIVYTINQANFKDNKYENYCYVYTLENKRTFQLTHGGSISNLKWLDDNSLLAIYTNPDAKDAKSQVYLFKDLTGSPIQLTDHKSGVMSFVPFENGILYLANDPDHYKERKQEFGDIVHMEREDSASNLYYLDIDKMIEYKKEIKLLDEEAGKKLPRPVLDLKKYLDTSRKIESIIVPPSRSKLFFINTRERDDLFFLETNKSYLMELSLLDHLESYLEYQKDEDKDKDEKDTFGEFNLKETNLIQTSQVLSFSPDEKRVMVGFKYPDKKLFYHQEQLALLDIKQLFQQDIVSILDTQCISKNFDRDPMGGKWTESGIYIGHIDYSLSKIVKLDEEGKVSEMDLGNNSPNLSFSIADDGTIACIVTNENNYYELAYFKENKLELISELGSDLENWKMGTAESITWKTEDGMEIEGVLRKPANFDPSKKYPMVFIVHGGPSWFSASHKLTFGLMRYYPATQFLNRGILVVEPNYRGSIGRGEDFKAKYAENIGFGDMADLDGAIDYLVGKGMVDETKIGCMGWSQGGYISAFVTTHSKRFAATSVGAGVASWKTYYDSNDIRQWALHYLGGSPISNPDYYKKTAPINSIHNASTPTLIQHGERDQRCPLSNATELYRALSELEIPTELFIYKGMPHGITKPRENMAVLTQNLKWFSHYLLDQELDWTS